MDFQIFASLPASDIDRAKAWYEKSLGVTPMMTADEDGTVFYMVGDSGFILYPSQFAGTNQATAAGLAVKDFDGAVASLKAAGVTFEDYDFGENLRTVDGIATMDDGRRSAWFKDSEGNILGLSENPMG
jgi:predicted enzyme related to lactoylglutathione lyase